MKELTLSFKKVKYAGEYFPDSKKVFIYLKNIYNIEDFYSTLEHEVLHSVLADLNIPIKKEHALIKALCWIDFYIA